MAPNVDVLPPFHTMDEDVPVYDLVIIGAGISGLGAAAQMAKDTNKSFVVLDRRESFGGTWDLFKYPGLRSDNSMRNYCYSWHRWEDSQTYASGKEIKNYLQTVIDKYALKQHIKYKQFVKRTNFDTMTNMWTVETENNVFRSKFLFCATGYYNYDTPYQPAFKGMNDFKGTHVHAQFWPEDLEYENKKMIIIGSGATAVTIGPTVCEKTQTCTVLQRSPSYMFADPRRSELPEYWRKRLPSFISYSLIYWLVGLYETYLAQWFYYYCQKTPEKMRDALLSQVADMPEHKEHFTPRYNPWEQRLCVVPDGDFFKSVKEGKITMCTDTIDTFTPTGIRLNSGKELEADIIVSCTGLNMQMCGGVKMYIDEKEVIVPEHASYRGCMLDNVPNFIYGFGYTNNSWTLRIDLVYDLMKKIFKNMDNNNFKRIHVKSPSEEDQVSHSTCYLTSGYISRGAQLCPKRGPGFRQPWGYVNYYYVDLWHFWWFNAKTDKDLVYA